jgi:hypothetical protein
MKVFLDREQSAPEGSERAYWPKEAIRLLETSAVEQLTLDNDLEGNTHETGYDVTVGIEEAVALRGFRPQKSMSTP